MTARRLDPFIPLPTSMDPLLREALISVLRSHALQINRMCYDRTAITSGQAVGASIVFVDATATASVQVVLPPAKDWQDDVIRVKKMNSNTNEVRIIGSNSETIDETATVVLTTQYVCLQLFSDGANWYIV